MKSSKMKKGGHVKETKAEEHKEEAKKKMKKEHKADGHKEHARADKRARGGRMSPSSPLSGASPKTMRSNGSEND